MVTHPSGLKVLIIDDEPMIRQVVRRMLEDKGYETEIADIAGKAIEMIQNHYFDVIPVDVRMSGMNGNEFYHQVREMNKQLATRIIFVTGDVLNTKTTEFIENNNVLLLAKPFSQDKLYDAINHAMQRCHYTTDIEVSTTNQEINFSEQYTRSV